MKVYPYLASIVVLAFAAGGCTSAEEKHNEDLIKVRDQQAGAMSQQGAPKPGTTPPPAPGNP